MKNREKSAECVKKYLILSKLGNFEVKTQIIDWKSNFTVEHDRVLRKVSRHKLKVFNRKRLRYNFSKPSYFVTLHASSQTVVLMFVKSRCKTICNTTARSGFLAQSLNHDWETIWMLLMISSSAYLWMNFISENRVAGNNFFLHVLIWNVQLNNFNISQQLVLSKKSWIRLFRRGLHKVVAYFRPSLSHVWYGVGRVACDWPVSERVFPACTTMSERMMKALLWFRHLLPFALIQPPVIHFTMPPKKKSKTASLITNFFFKVTVKPWASLQSPKLKTSM